MGPSCVQVDGRATLREDSLCVTQRFRPTNTPRQAGSAPGPARVGAPFPGRVSLYYVPPH